MIPVVALMLSSPLLSHRYITLVLYIHMNIIVIVAQFILSHDYNTTHTYLIICLMLIISHSGSGAMNTSIRHYFPSLSSYTNEHMILMLIVDL